MPQWKWPVLQGLSYGCPFISRDSKQIAIWHGRPDDGYVLAIRAAMLGTRQRGMVISTDRQDGTGLTGR